MARRFDDLMLGSLELFCLAAELESFTLAAQSAGLNPAAVSRTIGRLEDRLGVRLFVRSTRRIHLTEGGKAYFEDCRQALALLRGAESRATGEQQAPSGLAPQRRLAVRALPGASVAAAVPRALSTGRI